MSVGLREKAREKWLNYERMAVEWNCLTVGYLRNIA